MGDFIYGDPPNLNFLGLGCAGQIAAFSLFFSFFMKFFLTLFCTSHFDQHIDTILNSN